ncbi:MAG: hypothetical protein PWP27_388 [Clostridiales bacterium]|jgi:hypothetical protein|nr:hypothetical protein [Clostridiales bacterium]MDK2932578.1 hypothetical protein [Clostridiales bacterium]
MIKVIMDKKGTGKTKRLIELANSSIAQDSGDIVFVDNNNHHMYELNHEIRFIDTSEFEINDFCVFYGFLCGIISENFDISKIYIDGLFEIVNDDMDSLEIFLNDINKISDKFNIEFTMTISGDPKTVPAFLQQYM